MKQKEVFLDFTPLLDVTLILLFFFLLFSTFEIDEARAELSAQQAAAEARMAEADALHQQLEESLEIVESSDAQQASNTQALIDFNQGTNVKIILSMDGGNASLTISRGGEVLTTTTLDDNLAGIISTELQKAGYTEEDTILCEFIFDGSEAGTTSAYRKIQKSLLIIKEQYTYFYYSETDTSIGKD